MMNLVTVYLEPLFSVVFGCKTSSPAGLMILSALSMIFGTLSLLCLKIAVNISRADRMR